MMFPIILFLMVLSPLFIPVGVPVVGEYGNWRNRLAARPVGQFRAVPQFRPAIGLLPAAA
jgi:hypothetical protein